MKSIRDPLPGVLLTTQLGRLTLKNPILMASGTAGYGQELEAFADLSQLGAVIGKTVTRHPRAGNAPARVCETPAGMLNAIGLQNVGMERFIREKLPYLRQLNAKIVVNIAGETIEDFAELARDLAVLDSVDALELNISCPNVAHGLDFATDPQLTEQVVSAVQKALSGASTPVIAKLSPNVTDISLIARAAENGGAEALSVANTFVGMAVNARSRRPRLSNGFGGLSGPAIKPLALRAVYQCAQAVSIPIIGVGGISSGEDAAEFLIAGASAVQVGTATFVYPDAALRVLNELEVFLHQQGVPDVNGIVGTLQI